MSLRYFILAIDCADFHILVVQVFNFTCASHPGRSRFRLYLRATSSARGLLHQLHRQRLCLCPTPATIPCSWLSLSLIMADPYAAFDSDPNDSPSDHESPTESRAGVEFEQRMLEFWTEDRKASKSVVQRKKLPELSPSMQYMMDFSKVVWETLCETHKCGAASYALVHGWLASPCRASQVGLYLF